jgi:starch synthase
MTALIPLYLKTTYKNDPIYQNSKSVFTLYDNEFEHKFDGDLVNKAMMMDIEEGMLDNLKTADFAGFVKLGIEYADAVIKSKNETSEIITQLISSAPADKKVETIQKDDNFLDSYYNLYNELAG